MAYNPNLKRSPDFSDFSQQENQVADQKDVNQSPDIQNEGGVVPNEGNKEIEKPVEFSESTSVVSEVNRAEELLTSNAEAREEKMEEVLIHKSLDEISSANETVDALMNGDTPTENLNTIL